MATVEFGGPPAERSQRLQAMRALTYNDLSADRNCVAIVQALEAILMRHASGSPGAMVEVNGQNGGLVIYPRQGEPEVAVGLGVLRVEFRGLLQVLQGIIFVSVLASDALYGRIGLLKGKS